MVHTKSIQKKVNAMDDAVKSSDVTAIRPAWTSLKPVVNELIEDLRPPRLQSPANAWTQALLQQADEDLKAAETLAISKDTPCESVICMLLQMTFEKIGKAQLARSDFQAFMHVRFSHDAATRLVKTIRSQGALTGFSYKWKTVLPLVEALERAHPALAKKGPHLEYPWENEENVAIPRADLQVVHDVSNPRAAR